MKYNPKAGSISRLTPRAFLARWRQLVADPVLFDIEFRAMVDRFLYWDKGKPLAAAREMGRRGGMVGGRVRAYRLTPQRKSEIAKAAAAARWSKRGKARP